MSLTIPIQGSDEVMAMLSSRCVFYRGKWQKIRVTRPGTDENTPIEIRDSLVGLVIPTIFTKESLEEQIHNTLSIPAGSRLAYAVDVINALHSAEKYKAMERLRSLCPSSLDMYVFEKETYELVE
jgi:hypothetical protein